MPLVAKPCAGPHKVRTHDLEPEKRYLPHEEAHEETFV